MLIAIVTSGMSSAMISAIWFHAYPNSRELPILSRLIREQRINDHIVLYPAPLMLMMRRRSSFERAVETGDENRNAAGVALAFQENNVK